MKKRVLPILLIIFLILIAGATLFACENKISNLKVKYETVRLPENGKLYIENYIEYDGSGTPDYAVENLDVLYLEGSEVTGIMVGNGKVIISAGDETVSFIVEVYSDTLIEIDAKDVNTVYDGTMKNIFVNLSCCPDGTDVVYTCGDEEIDGFVLPGRYEITVAVIPPEGYTVFYENYTAVLFIDKATVDMEGVDFLRTIYTYDGTEKKLEITGELPKGVTVSYENNKGTDAGTYKALACFEVDTELYYDIPARSAHLIIEPKEIVYSDLGFKNTSFIYDGTFKYLAFEQLPEGFSVEYSVYNEKTKSYDNLTDITTSFKNVGKYQIKASLQRKDDNKNNYLFESEKTAILEIKKADYVGKGQWSLSNIEESLVYDKNKRIIVGENGSLGDTRYLYIDALPHGVNGEHPDDISVEYYLQNSTSDILLTEANNVFQNAGDYTIIAKFKYTADTNYKDIENKIFTLTIKKADYILKNKDGMLPIYYNGSNFVFDNALHTFEVEFDDGFEALYPDFLKDIKIEYQVNENGMGYTEKTESPILLKDVGYYECKAVFSFVVAADAKNYNIIPTRACQINIKKLKVDASGIKFNYKDVDYNGMAHSLKIDGNIPDGTTAYYSENNSQINSGEYQITAQLLYSLNGYQISYKNFEFVGNEKIKDYSMSAVLKINRINYKENEIPELISSNGIYSPDKTLKDYSITDKDGNAAENVRWKTPNTVPVVAIKYYEALYNVDNVNYNDYQILIPIDISPLAIDKNDISIKNQFVPFTGKTVKPILTVSGYSDVDEILKLGTVEDDALISIGKHSVTAMLRFADENNFVWKDGEFEPVAVTIYIYDSAKYTYEQNSTKLLKYTGDMQYVEIMSGTESVYKGAFADNAYIKALILPSTVASLGTGAIDISSLPNLEKLTLPFTGRVKDDGQSFGTVFNMTNDKIPSHLKEVVISNQGIIYENSFRNCFYIENVIFNEEVESIEDYAFTGCKKMSSLNFGHALKFLGSNAFQYCFALKEISLPFVGNNEESDKKTAEYLLGQNLNENAFENYSLEKFELYGGWTALPSKMFAGLSSLKIIEFPENLNEIGEKCFENVAAEINLNDSFVTITKNMFYGYKGKKLTLPSVLTKIEPYAFSGADVIECLSIPKTVSEIGEFAFKNFKGQIIFEDNSAMTYIGTNTFRQSNFIKIELPSTVSYLGDYAFAESGLVMFNLYSQVTDLGKGIFKDCENLKTVTAETTILTEELFYNCNSLTDIILINTKIIYENAFSQCDSIQKIVLPESMESIYGYAFYGCKLLDNVFISKTVGLVNLYGTNVFDTATKVRVADVESYKIKYPQYSFITK